MNIEGASRFDHTPKIIALF